MVLRDGKKVAIFYGNRDNIKMRRIMNNVSVLVIRWNGSRFMNSRPCKHCSDMLKQMGVKTIYYSDEDGSISYERVKDLHSDRLSFARRSGLDL